MPENTIEKSIKKSERKKAKGFLTFLKVLLALIILVVTIAAIVLVINFVTNTTVKETFYQMGCTKVESNIRIVQISDLHNSTLFGGNDAVIARVKKLKPDVIALTGDMVNKGDSNDKVALDFCEKLAKIAPTYYVYGNHEAEKEFGFDLTKKELEAVYSRTEFDASAGHPFTENHRGLQSDLEERGVKVLHDAMDTITVGEDNVDIYGALVTDPFVFWQYASDDLSKYMRSNKDNLKVMLCHAPYIMSYYDGEPLGDLVLSGHTHGGLVRIPGIGSIYDFFYGFLPEKNDGYIYGAYEFSDKALIVTSGLTNRNIFRINNQPEIVIVDINRY